MLKYSLIGAIFILCSYTGVIIGKKYLNRQKNLNEVSKYMVILQNEILYKSSPIPEALEELSFRSNEEFSKIFLKVGEDLKEGKKYSVYEAFKDTYLENKENFYFAKEDEKVIGDFLKVLGESGIYGQEKIFDLFKLNINKNLKEAEEISKKNSKLYGYLGVLTGAMIAIFLM